MSSADPRPMATTGTVRVVGTGLLGASVGLGLATCGVDVALHDTSPTALAMACALGAGRPAAAGDRPSLVVVATPPDVTARVVLAELAAHPAAVVTDVASVKGSVLDAVAAAGGDLTRYVGSHPMAGRETSGPTSARADLFAGRPWVIADSSLSTAHALLTVRALAGDLGATPVTVDARSHDRAVALVSHLPQVMASLIAARLQDAPEPALDLAGQGLRDATRVAGSDAMLWASILAANTGPLRELLAEVRADLDSLIAAIDAAGTSPAADGALLGALAGTIAAGNRGVERIPGKHGGAHRHDDVVTVLVPDSPGELARLLGDVGAAGINLEDLRLEHSARQPVGLAALSVLAGSGERLTSALTERGWRLAG